MDRQLDLGRSLQVWLNLQNGVNALFDSTSTTQNLGTQVAPMLCTAACCLQSAHVLVHESASLACISGIHLLTAIAAAAAAYAAAAAAAIVFNKLQMMSF